MRGVLLLATALGLAQTVAGQTETFDIATFVAPQGWSRAEQNGILILQQRKAILRRTEFCQIYLFPSRTSQAGAQENFGSEWATRIRGTFGVGEQASRKSLNTQDGWTVVIGAADTVREGVAMRTLLSTATGFGSVFSVLVVVSPNSYVNELNAFFHNLKLHNGYGGNSPATATGEGRAAIGATAPGTGAFGAASSVRGGPLGYSFTPPPQWSEQELRDQIVLTSPVYQNGERCQITILPMQEASSARLPDVAIGTFCNIFRADPLAPYPSQPSRLASGTSPAGWEFFTIHKLVGGQEGDGKGIGTILLTAKVGDRIATIYGISKDFIVSNCFGELVRDVWPGFFYSLTLQGAQSGQQQNLIRQKLAGTWIAATGTVGNRYEFHSDGRYAGAAARRQYSRDSVTTTAFFGDGSYSFEGNQLVLSGDDGRRSTFFFRLELASRDSGATWSDQLCLLSPGMSGEVCYRKN
ncbi:MAG TPA: hypothetical protein VN737_21895 [Bryobacteraceae bacterium]|nr:hypothetical protein [Bryobacteraceae bacterium]